MDLSTDTQTPPIVPALLSNGHCVKARRIAERLTQLGVAFDTFDVDADDTAQRAFGALFHDGRVKAPALVIGARVVRNPSVASLQKVAARYGLIERVMLHDEAYRRFVWPMRPSDAFASYVWRESPKGNAMHVGHIEVDPKLRGKGLGMELASELLEALTQSEHRVRLTCPFLRKVAARKETWRARFL